MGIDTSSIPLYLNVVFFGLLGLGMFFGFMRGLRKSVYSFVVKLVFYLIFFATLGVVSRFLWNAEFAFIGSTLSMVTTGMGGVASLSEALPIIIENYLGGSLNADLTNPDFVAFAEGLGMFVVKIIYAILYFTVIQLFYKIITWIIYLIFFKPKKEDVEVHGKHRLPGMAVGLLSGALAVYATLVLLGGVMSISESLVTLAEGLETEETANRPDDTSPVDDDPVLRLASRPQAVPMQTDPAPDAALEDLGAIVDAYNDNVIVSSFTSVDLTDEETGRETPLNLHLFDMIFSFEYKEEDIAFRSELAVFTDVAGIFLDSEYRETNDLSDLEGSEIRDMFTELSNSRLLTSLMPVALEMGAEHYEVDLDLERDDLYAIDYRNELSQLGEVFATAFDMLNNAGALDSDADLDIVSLDGDEAEAIFQGLGDSELATLGAYVAMEPLLENYLGENGAVLTVPEGIVWEDEFDAFGEVSKAILDTGITLGEIQSGDIMLYLQKLSSMDLTVILNSRIIEQALVNVLSGAAEIEGMDMMVVNDDIQWQDEVVDGDIVEDGELRIVLDALNAFADNEDVDAIESFDQNVLLNISEATLDAFLESTVLTDTIGDFIVNLETDALVIPPSTLKTITVDGDDREVVNEDEIRNMFLAVQTIEIADFETVEFSADLLSALEDEDDPGTLDTTDSGKLFSSKILHATISDVLTDLTEDANQTLVVPDTDVDGDPLYIDSDHEDYNPEDDGTDYIVTTELEAVLETVIVLDLTDFETIDSLDAETLSANMSTLLKSAILHATISDQVVQLDTDGTITVPYYEDDDTTAVRVTESGTEFITKDELEATITALDTLDILDFDTFDGAVDLSVLDTEANRNTVLASSILQATVSKQLVDLHDDDSIVLPYYDEDDSTQIRVMSTSGATDVEYVTTDELDRLIQALDVLDILDVESFDGTVDLSMLGGSQTNRDTVLASSTLQATVSKQLVDLHDQDSIVLPYYDEDDTTAIRKMSTAGATDVEYVTTDELDRLIQALDVLDILDVESFDGTVDLTPLEDSPGNRNTIVSSVTLQATITEQLVDLDSDGTIVLPYYNQDNDDLLRKTSTSGSESVEFVTQTELENLLHALDILDILDVESFDGSVDLSLLAEGTNASTVLDSSTIQATVSDQLITLHNDGTITLPYIASDDATDIRVLADAHASVDTEYVVKNEIETLIDALDILGITNVESYDGAITLDDFYDETNRNILLSSATMHATISEQMFDLGASKLVIPENDVDDNDVQTTTVNATLGPNTTYVVEDEIHAVIQSMEVLGINDINSFAGNVDLTNVYEDNGDDTNQDILLSSASIHATIVQQIDDTLGSSTLLVPDDDLQDNTVRTATSFEADLGTRYYITKTEIKSLINSMEILGINDITAYDGSFTLDDVASESEQDRLLESASIHATFSRELLDLDDAVLIVPNTEQDGSTEVKDTNTSAEEFVVKGEIKALIDAFLAMGYSDLDGFGTEIESTRFFDSRDTLLNSSAIQATVSDKLLNDTGGALLVPDEDISGTDLRLLSNTYIEINELEHLLDALDELDLQDFNAIEFTPDNVFGLDYDIILLSASVQITLSDTILGDAATDKASATTVTQLIVPDSAPGTFRETLPVDGVNTEQIEIDELKALLEALDTIGVTAFDGSLDASAVTDMTSGELDTVLSSGSAHVTIDHMIESNSEIDVPQRAEIDPDPAYGTDIITTSEIKAFVAAAKTVADPGEDITNIGFDLTTIQNMDQNDQDTIGASMIARNTLTPDIEGAYLATVGSSIPNTYYHEDDTGTFLDETGFHQALQDIEDNT